MRSLVRSGGTFLLLPLIKKVWITVIRKKFETNLGRMRSYRLNEELQRMCGVQEILTELYKDKKVKHELCLQRVY